MIRRQARDTNARFSISSATDIIGFWRDAGTKRWFTHDPAFDGTITERFGEAHIAASRGVLSGWEKTADGALALLILTDQFPRNMYRGSAHAFATDAMARAIADRAIAQGLDMACAPDLRQFFYLPFQHHEDLGSQMRAVALTEKLVADGAAAEDLKYARLHQELIARFGRFPHRNAMMGRISTPQETEYLANGGFAG
jgi:uncharacterized protein (DUF924 family)